MTRAAETSLEPDALVASARRFDRSIFDAGLLGVIEDARSGTTMTAIAVGRRSSPREPSPDAADRLAWYVFAVLIVASPMAARFNLRERPVDLGSRRSTPTSSCRGRTSGCS